MRSFIYNPPTDPYLDIVYQDDHILLINKPSGLLSVSGREERYIDSATYRILQKHSFCEPAHRLDMATSGLLLFALSKKADRILKMQFRHKQVEKSYLALAWGYVDPSLDGTIIDLPLRCNWDLRPRQMVCFEHGKASQTLLQILSYNKNNSTKVRLSPITGRSHQLRVHMASLGHPLLGDKFYADKTAFNASKRLCLQAQSISFYHPISDEKMSFTLNDDF